MQFSALCGSATVETVLYSSEQSPLLLKKRAVWMQIKAATETKLGVVQVWNLIYSTEVWLSLTDERSMKHKQFRHLLSNTINTILPILTRFQMTKLS